MSQTVKKQWRVWGTIAGAAVVGGALSIACVTQQQPDAPAKPPPPAAAEKPEPAAPPNMSVAPAPQVLANQPGCSDMPTSITVAPCLPSDIPGGAPKASLQAAAIFAWQEFIALSWPSMDENGGANTRGVPDPNKRLEVGQDESSSQLPTWATFRHKNETLPGDMSRPHGAYGTSGYYDDLPKYIYAPSKVGQGYAGLATGQIPPCDPSSPFNTAENETFVTADENSQIGQDFMFAGKNDVQDFGSNAGTPAGRSQVQFLVKVNRTYFDYITSKGHSEPWWPGIPPDVRARTVSYLAANLKDPPAGSMDMVSFPSGTMMVKSAWRRANKDDISSGRYFIKKVRYYEHQQQGQSYGGQKGNPAYFCYSTNYYALIGIHILQKTPSAPYFIYATFEQADNILTDNGTSIEDENGAVQIFNQPPLTPALRVTNATATREQTFNPRNANCPPGSSLYYMNAPASSALIQGKVCVRGREHPIPQAIIDINKKAHALLQAYAAAPAQLTCQDEGLPCTTGIQCCSGRCNKLGFTAGCAGGPPARQPQAYPMSRLNYYKLVNVQAAPFDKPAGVDYAGSNPDPATYYLSNDVVETNYPLQVFSGTFFAKPDLTKPGTSITDGSITDFVNGAPFKNTLYGPDATQRGQGYNMGGCMGCHGIAQSRGGGFSFAFEGVRDKDGNPEDFDQSPEVAEGPNARPSAEFVQRYQRLLNH